MAKGVAGPHGLELDRSAYRPVMRVEVPFRDTRAYWSSSTFGRHKNSAWIVNFDGAYVLSYFKTNQYNVRCVRGTMQHGSDGEKNHDKAFSGVL